MSPNFQSKRLARTVAAVLATVVLLTLPAAVQSQDRVLFVAVKSATHHSYITDGQAAYSELLDFSANADYLELTVDGQVADAIIAAEVEGDPYDQIWSYDLAPETDSYPIDIQAIVDWFWDQASPELICDGRFLSSFWLGRSPGEGRALVENYYVNMGARGGGLLLATDHILYSAGFTNELAAILGIDPFVGQFGGSFPVDPENPLVTTPNDLTAGLKNDSTTGQTPFNLQPNGLVLHTVGFHTGNTETPGISSTIKGSLNFTVTIDSPASGYEMCEPETVLAQSVVGPEDEIEPPVLYTWTSDQDGFLGDEQDQLLDSTMLSAGTHIITVESKDARDLVDKDQITVLVNQNCEPPPPPPPPPGEICEETISDSDAGVPSKRLGQNRWADIDGDGLFDTKGKNPTGRMFSLDDTGGCSCAQIIDICGYGKGHEKFGCSHSVMDTWTGLYDRAGEEPFQCKSD